MKRPEFWFEGTAENIGERSHNHGRDGVPKIVTDFDEFILRERDTQCPGCDSKMASRERFFVERMVEPHGQVTEAKFA